MFNQLRLARQRFVAGHTDIESFDDEDGVNETLAQVLASLSHQPVGLKERGLLRSPESAGF